MLDDWKRLKQYNTEEVWSVHETTEQDERREGNLTCLFNSLRRALNCFNHCFYALTDGKTADIQAHSAALGAALWACISAVFHQLKNKNDVSSSSSKLKRAGLKGLTWSFDHFGLIHEETFIFLSATWDCTWAPFCEQFLFIINILKRKKTSLCILTDEPQWSALLH